MMLLGLMSRWTSFRSWTAANPAATWADFQRQLYLKPARSLNKTLQSLSFDEFHGIEVVLTSSAEVED
jgi:hypothetical protein